MNEYTMKYNCAMCMNNHIQFSPQIMINIHVNKFFSQHYELIYVIDLYYISFCYNFLF